MGERRYVGWQLLRSWHDTSGQQNRHDANILLQSKWRSPAAPSHRGRPVALRPVRELRASIDPSARSVCRTRRLPSDSFILLADIGITDKVKQKAQQQGARPQQSPAGIRENAAPDRHAGARSAARAIARRADQAGGTRQIAGRSPPGVDPTGTSLIDSLAARGRHRSKRPATLWPTSARLASNEYPYKNKSWLAA
jgi:hypothetical protein